MKKLRVGGVPEHFNFPWHLAMKQGRFASLGIEVEFTEYADGTGAMCRDLRADVLDVAVVLTEGIVADIAHRGGSKIIAAYVDTPLTWGIHVAVDAPFEDIAGLEGQPLAISRFGSGSHLMSTLMAKERGWDIDELCYEPVNGGLPELTAALDRRRATAFLWERFTTKPLIDAGAVRRVGEYPTPWPCFVIAAREALCESAPEVLRVLLEVIQESCAIVEAKGPEIAPEIAARYSLEPEDVTEWMKGVRWSHTGDLDREVIATTAQVLAAAGRVPERVDIDGLIRAL